MVQGVLSALDPLAKCLIVCVASIAINYYHRTCALHDIFSHLRISYTLPGSLTPINGPTSIAVVSRPKIKPS